jgi:hypothetical protein
LVSEVDVGPKGRQKPSDRRGQRVSTMAPQ